MLKSIDKIEFDSKLYREYSATSSTDDLGESRCTMELFGYDDPYRYNIEFIMIDIDEVQAYGIWCERENGILTLTDYDGGFVLPKQAIALLRKNGITVPEDFE